VTLLERSARWLVLAATLLPAPALAEDPTPATPPPAAPEALAFEGPGLELRAGLGFYEAANVGVTWRISERHAVGLLAGSNFGVPQTAVNTLGLDWRYIERKLAGFESAFLVRALTWTAVDDLYRWKLLSAQLGGSFSRPIGPRTSIALDATLVRTFVLESDRKQDQAFGNPQEWNLSACLSISHRVAGW
jgi:hypothetical protein